MGAVGAVGAASAGRAEFEVVEAGIGGMERLLGGRNTSGTRMDETNPERGLT